MPICARPGDEDDPSVPAARLAPGAAQPAQLRRAPGDRRLGLELERRGARLERAQRRPGLRGDDLDHLEPGLEPFQLDEPAALELRVIDHPGAFRDRGGDHDLARRGHGAEPRGGVQRRAPEPVLDRDRLAGVDPDADVKGQGRVGGLLLCAGREQLDRGAHGLDGRGEHRERLVAAKLDHLPAARRDGIAGEVGEPDHEPRRLRIAVLAREARVAADVGDQERALDRRRRAAVSRLRRLDPTHRRGPSHMDAMQARRAEAGAFFRS